MVETVRQVYPTEYAPQTFGTMQAWQQPAVQVQPMAGQMYPMGQTYGTSGTKVKEYTPMVRNYFPNLGPYSEGVSPRYAFADEKYVYVKHPGIFSKLFVRTARTGGGQRPVETSYPVAISNIPLNIRQPTMTQQTTMVQPMMTQQTMPQPMMIQQAIPQHMTTQQAIPQQIMSQQPMMGQQMMQQPVIARQTLVQPLMPQMGLSQPILTQETTLAQAMSHPSLSSGYITGTYVNVPSGTIIPEQIGMSGGSPMMSSGGIMMVGASGSQFYSNIPMPGGSYVQYVSDGYMNYERAIQSYGGLETEGLSTQGSMGSMHGTGSGQQITRTKVDEENIRRNVDNKAHPFDETKNILEQKLAGGSSSGETSSAM